MAAMDWFYNMLIASNVVAEDASKATAIVAVIITMFMLKSLFSAIFPKR